VNSNSSLDDPDHGEKSAIFSGILPLRYSNNVRILLVTQEVVDEFLWFFDGGAVSAAKKNISILVLIFIATRIQEF